MSAVITRREFGAGLAAIISAGIAPSSLGYGVRGLAARGVAIGGSGGETPLPYQQVEWIGSGITNSNYPYVDTLESVKAGDVITLDWMMNSTPVQGYVLGSLGTRRFGVYSYYGDVPRTIGFYTWGGEYRQAGVGNVDGHCVIVLDTASRTVTINGTVIRPETGAEDSSRSVTLFTLNDGGSQGSLWDGKHTEARIASYVHSRGGKKIRDFVPVKVDGVGYFYDRANPSGGPNEDGLYGASGVGVLAVGPDKVA